MNSLEILQKNKAYIESIYKSIHQQLIALAGGSADITMPGVEVITKENPFEVNVIGLLRLGTAKGKATYALGYSDPNFPAIWTELFPKKEATEADASVKSNEFELMKSYFTALEPTLRAEGFQVDPKMIILQEAPHLGDWAKIMVQSSIKLPMILNGKTLTFEIPVFGLEDTKKKTEDSYGFKENARFVVVDDSLVSRKHARSCLAMAGYFNIDECPDGQVALSKVMGANPPIEFVVADWHMPVMSGFELLKKLRAIPDFRKLPILLVTGEKNKEEVVNAIREGVSGYLVKPVSPEDFFKALKKAGKRG